MNPNRATACSGPILRKVDEVRAVRWWLGLALMMAGGAFCSLHLGRSFGASESYSALAASQPNYAAVVRIALRFDPGKPPLYQLILHTVAITFGDSEPALRAPSVIFAVISVGLILSLGTEMFGPSLGVVAAIFWVLNPLAIIYGAWARMYALLIALSLGQFLLLWRLRTRPTAGRVAAGGLLGAMMLYTHLGAALLLGAEAVMLIRETWRGERNRAGWVVMAVALALFIPFLKTASSQVTQLIFGHWVDWIGPAHRTGLMRKVAAVMAAGFVMASLTFGPRMEPDNREPIRWCAALALIPVSALAAGSIVIRPMFTIRYVAPCGAFMTLLVARFLWSFGERGFRLATVGIVTALVCLLPHYPWYEPWPDITRLVSGGPPTAPVFFESGFVGSNEAESNPEEGFPNGYFRIPFDRYFSGPNPRRVIDPSRPAADRQAVAAAAAEAKAAWLVSGFGAETARAELPEKCYKVDLKIASEYTRLYQVVPSAGNGCRPR